MRSIGHQQQSASASDSGLSSPAPSRSDRFSAFLPLCLCAMCSWVFPSFSSLGDWRSEPAWWCCWQASWGHGQSNSTFFCRSVRPLVLDLLSSTGPRFSSSLAIGYQRFCADSCWWNSGPSWVLLELFSMFPIHRGVLTSHLGWIFSTWWIFQSLWRSKLTWE